MKNSGGKNDLVLGGRVVRVHRGWGHAPSRPVDRHVQLLHVVDEAVVSRAEVVPEVIVAYDRQVLILFFKLKQRRSSNLGLSKNQHYNSDTLESDFDGCMALTTTLCTRTTRSSN